MPVITVDWIAGRNKQQKAMIVEEITRTMVRVAGAKPENVRIIINDHSKDDLAMGGRLLSDIPAE